MLVLAGPSKVEGVMLGNNMVKNGMIHQEISWNLRTLRYNAFPEYLIRYADNQKSILNRKFHYSSKPNATLQLLFRPSNFSYYVIVAVRSTEIQKRGDFSDPVSISYQ